MKRLITLTGLAMAIGLATTGAQAADYVAEKDYRVLDNEKKLAVMLSLFVNFSGMVARIVTYLTHIWKNGLKHKDKDVAFFKTPAALNPVWEANARGFYAAQLLGFEDKTHDALFDAIQKDGQKLFDQQSLSKWYASQGVDEKKFNSLYNSFAVGTKIGRSQAGAKRYQLSGVPTVVVQGKYVISWSRCYCA